MEFNPIYEKLFEIARAGDVNPTYPVGDPRYGMPMSYPDTGKPVGMNEAEFNILQDLRKRGVIPQLPTFN